MDWWFLIVPGAFIVVAWVIDLWDRRQYARRRREEEQERHRRLMCEVRRHPANGPR